MLADTHLLGKIKAHWLDKMLREWQMKRSFQAAMAIHKPEAVFILGKSNLQIRHISFCMRLIWNSSNFLLNLEKAKDTKKFQQKRNFLSQLCYTICC